MCSFRDTGHLFRFAGIFVIALLLFLAIRGWLVPHSFGQYGHYRGAAMSEISARPIRYAGHQTCETCHADIVEKKSASKHASVNCEACHGPLAAHADDPSIQPAKLDTATLCIQCHEQSAAKPKNFPQVEPQSHSTGVPCETCHQSHSPAIETGGAK
jgi:hypothetical protein